MPRNLSDLDSDLSRSPRSIVIARMDSQHMLSLLMLNSNIWTNIPPLRDIMLQNTSDFGFEISMLLKVKCESVFGLAIYGLLLMF